MFEKNCQSYIFDNKKYVLDESGQLKEILVDFSVSGRVNPHSNNKRMTNYLSEVYEYISDHTVSGKFLDFKCDKHDMLKKRNKLSFCSNYLEFAHLKDNSKHISYIESCHKSLCPTCNFFRSRNNLSDFVAILTEFFNSEYTDYPFLFLTLTVPSCYGEDLSSTLDSMSSAWNRFIQSSAFSSAFVASSRSLEITVNRDEDSKSYKMFHPHYHVILVARPDYFSRQKNYYLDQLHLLWLWQRAYKNHTFRSFDKWLSWYSSFFSDFGTPSARLLPSAPEGLITQLDIRRIKTTISPDRAVKNIMGALNECLKYPFKPDDLLTGVISEDSEIVFFMDKAMFHRRRWNITGIFKEISISLDQSTDEPEDLVSVRGLDPDEIDFFSAWWFSGKFGEYLRGKKKSIQDKNKARRFLGLPEIQED